MQKTTFMDITNLLPFEIVNEAINNRVLGPNGLDLNEFKRHKQPLGEWRYVGPMGSLNLVGGVAIEINVVNNVALRSWLSPSNIILGFFFFVGHV